MKKLISIVLAIVMVLSVFSVTAYAVNNGPSDQTWWGDLYIAYISLNNPTAETYTRVFGNNTVYNDAVAGATYDRESNTLTLDSYNAPDTILVTNMMGDDFKLNVQGECVLSQIVAYGDHYGGSLNIVGNGTLTVNESKQNDYGVELRAEFCDAKLNIADETAAAVYGKLSAVKVFATDCDDASKVISFGSKAVTDLTGEKYVITSDKTIKGVYKSDSKNTYEKKVVSKTDPDGVYAASFFSRFIADKDAPYDEDMEDYGYWKPLIGVNKYIYNEYFDTYVNDRDFTTLEFTEDEFKNSDYSYVEELSKSPKRIPFYSSDAPLDQTWHYEAYIFNNPDDPDGLYYTGSDLFKDRTADDEYYSLSEFTYDETYKNYVMGSSTRLNMSQFDEAGYTFKMAGGDEPETMHYYDIEENSDSYITYLVNNPNDPDGVYGLNVYPYVNPDENFSCGRLVYNEEHQRYEDDKTYDSNATISQNGFKENGYTYVYEMEPVDFEYCEIYTNWYDVYKDNADKEYALDYNENVFDFSEDAKVKLYNDDYYVVTPNGEVKSSDLTQVIETTDTDCYSYIYNSTELTKSAESTPTNVTEATEATQATEATGSTQATEATQQTESTAATQSTEPTQATEATQSVQPTQPSKPAAKISAAAASLNAGATKALKVTNGTVKSWSTSNKAVATVSKGKITALKKGSATITATLTNGKKLTCKVTVKTSPKLSKSSVTVKKGGSVKVNIKGKAATVKNVYTNTKIAKVMSSNTATSIKVKGLKKGTTTLKIKVNGVVLKLKVKVK